MKRGQPKCICSPQCKAATATINKNRKVGVNEEFTAIELPEMRSVNRHYSVVRPPIAAEMQNDEPSALARSARKSNQSSEALANHSSSRMLETRFRNKLFGGTTNILHIDEFHLGSIVS
jgi:hypothetical protein